TGSGCSPWACRGSGPRSDYWSEDRVRGSLRGVDADRVDGSAGPDPVDARGVVDVDDPEVRVHHVQDLARDEESGLEETDAEVPDVLRAGDALEVHPDRHLIAHQALERVERHVLH